MADIFEWLVFQVSQRAAPSTSTMRAELPKLKTTAVKPSTEASKAAVSEIWQGWLCYHKGLDLKLALFDINSKGTIIEYAQGNSDLGPFNEWLEASFVDNRLHSNFFYGAELDWENAPMEI